MKYLKRYSLGKTGKCKICLNNCEFSGDHFPPSASGNSGQFTVSPEYAKMAKESAKPLLFQNGVKFYAICEKCNNKIGSDYDRALIKFINELSRQVKSKIILPSLLTVNVHFDNLMRALAAHYLATSLSATDTEYDKIFRNFLQLKISKLPIHVHVAICPSMDTVIVKDNAKAKFSNNSTSHIMFSLFKFFPVAIVFCDQKSFHDWENLNKYEDKVFIDGTIDFKISKKVMCHPNWPEHPMDNEFNMFNSEFNAPIRASKWKGTKQ